MLNLSEVQSEPEATASTAHLPGDDGSWIGGGDAHGRVWVPRPFYSHRIITLATGQDWCVGCGIHPDPTQTCLPALARCDSCGQHPAMVNDRGYKVCATCVNGGREW